MDCKIERDRASHDAAYTPKRERHTERERARETDIETHIQTHTHREREREGVQHRQRRAGGTQYNTDKDAQGGRTRITRRALGGALSLTAPDTDGVRTG